MWFTFLLLLAIPAYVTLNAYKEKHEDENNTEAFEKYKKNITIGTSIDYDRLGYYGEILIKKYKLNIDQYMFWNQENQIKLIEELINTGLRKFRINFRWRDLSDEGTEINFEKIEKILNYFESQNNLEFTICFGPFKNFSYPEQYVPAKIIEKYLKKNKTNVIHSQEEIVTIAKAYLENLIQQLHTRYPHIIEQTVAFQTNNEGFHPFGSIPIKTTNETEYQIIKTIEKQFPSQKFLFNTPIVSFPRHIGEALHPDIADVQSFLTFLEQRDPSILYKTILGLNYYAAIGEGVEKTPFSQLDSITATQIISTFSRNPTLIKFNGFISYIAKKYQNSSSGFEIKVSELQEEAWNGDFRGEESGKSINISQRNLNRLTAYISRLYEIKTLSIDIWGAEQMAVYAYLNKSLGSKPEEFIVNAQKSAEVLNFYKQNFKL